MSATNRGAKRSKSDFYATPESAFKPLIPYLPGSSRYWEPAAGDGRLIQWLSVAGMVASGGELYLPARLYDQRVATKAIWEGYDFLQDKTQHDFIITNPPFSLAREFVQHGLNHSREIALLLRLNFLGAIERKDWWAEHAPSALFVLSRRPSFGLNAKGKKGTDACDYAWFYWGRRYQGLRWI